MGRHKWEDIKRRARESREPETNVDDFQKPKRDWTWGRVTLLAVAIGYTTGGIGEELAATPLSTWGVVVLTVALWCVLVFWALVPIITAHERGRRALEELKSVRRDQAHSLNTTLSMANITGKSNGAGGMIHESWQH